MEELNVLNNTNPANPEVPKEQERINVSNIPPKSIGERELKDSVVIRKITTTQRDVMANLTAGVLIWNSSTNKLNVYNGSSWEVITSV